MDIFRGGDTMCIEKFRKCFNKFRYFMKNIKEGERMDRNEKKTNKIFSQFQRMHNGNTMLGKTLQRKKR